jgi:hypothetical protein
VLIIGTAEHSHSDEVLWTYHPDSSVDVAATVCLPPDHIDWIPWPATHFALPQTLEAKNIGAGDLAYITGLFRVVTGHERFMPVVHTGHIAMLPAEKVPVNGFPSGVDAYLVEAQSIGGLSGSPVFVRRSVRVLPAKDEVSGVPPLAYGAMWLLGLWQAGWQAPASSVFGPEGLKGAVIPAGMGVVVPASKILEVLNLPKFRERRDELARKKYDESAASLN